MKKILVSLSCLALIGCGGGSSASNFTGNGAAPTASNFASLLNLFPAKVRERVSTDSSGQPLKGYFELTGLSQDGNLVSFVERGGDLFVKDRQTGALTRESVDPSGKSGISPPFVQPNGPGKFSGSGRLLVFFSACTNLVAGDTNGKGDIFVRDRQTSSTTRVSVDANGAQQNDEAGGCSISADGRYVAFSSRASNLVAGDTNGSWDVFVKDRQTGQVVRVSTDSGGVQGNADSGRFFRSFEGISISEDGRFVAFSSEATNLAGSGPSPGVFVKDLQTQQTSRVNFSGKATDPVISGNGRFVTFVGSTNDLLDVYLFDRQSGQTETISVAPGGQLAGGIQPQVSRDGRFVLFRSDTLRSVIIDPNSGYYDGSQIFVRDRLANQTFRVSVKAVFNSRADVYGDPSLSADGRFAAFIGADGEFVAKDPGTSGSIEVDLSSVP